MLILLLVACIRIVNYAYGSNCELEIDIEKNCYKQYTENYKYHNFFPVVENPTKNDNTLVSVTFYVKADHDAHVLLTTGNNQTDNDPVYEIVFGGAGNTAAEIRKGHKAKGERAVMMKDLVSRNEWKAFWIRIIDDGTILVGKKEDDLPFLHWKDPKPLAIKYYGFSSWDNTVALWAHRCSRNQTNVSQPSEKSINNDAHEDAIFCEDYATEIPYYTRFFPIERLNTTSEDSFSVNLTFYVLAERNARILLSSTIQPSANERVYEIALGAANNTVSELRRMQMGNSKVSVKMTDAVSQNEWKGYWILVRQNGSIQVGKQGQNKPFIHWKEPYPLHVKYYSFSTSENVPTSWKHRCSKINSTDERDRISARFAPATDTEQVCKSLRTANVLYHQFFPIEKSNSSDLLTSIKFNVKAGSDAHIFLSPKSKPLINEPGYEIVLGSAGNTASEIRRGQKTENKTKVPTANIVSSDEWNSFWIWVKPDGLIMVGKEGEDWPIVYWRDPKPLPINYYGFSSWQGVEALWEHQCPPSDSRAQPLTRTQKDPETPGNCQTVFTYNYNYTQFYPIDKANLSGDSFVFLTFYVKADSNAHILLSRTPTPTEREPVYEIVLGSANNVASEIRKGQKTENKEMKYMTNSVSRDEWRAYWIRIEADGLIMVGNDRDDFPFMYWRDTEPFKIEYYSFSSWYDTTALWKHRCIQSDEKSSNNASKTCKTFYTQGFNYFPLIGAEKSSKTSNVVFELTFDVKTDNLASVLLATTSKPIEKDLVYEIVLGPGNNTLSEIRRGQKADGRTMAVIVTTDVPPSNDWKRYWIQITNDGSILVGKLGDDLNLPFLRWKDPKPLHIKYFGFSSTANSIALWQYQCIQLNNQQAVDSQSSVGLQSLQSPGRGRGNDRI